MGNNALPLISVIIPIYNAEKYLSRCLDSVLEQDYDNYEVIMVNDGSSDNSLDICNQYVKKDKRFSVITQKNKGVSEARNTGLSAAKGDYLQFIDSDDFILPGMFSTMYKEIIATECDFVACQHGFGNVNDKQYTMPPSASILNKFFFDSNDFEKIMVENKDLYQCDLVIAPWNKLYRKSIFDDLYFEGSYAEDIKIADIINSKHYKIKVIPNVFYIYCSNPDSIMHNLTIKDRLQYLDALEMRAALYSDDSFISNKTKKVYCDLFVEYFFQCYKKKIDFNTRTRKPTFLQYLSDLQKARFCNIKYFIRMYIFLVLPRFYGKYTHLL